MIDGRKLTAAGAAALLLAMAGCEQKGSGETGATKDEAARSGQAKPESADAPGGSAGTTGGLGGASSETPGQTGGPGGENATSASEPGAPDGGKSQKESGGGEYGTK
jgi:hypothetical protein